MFGLDKHFVMFLIILLGGFTVTGAALATQPLSSNNIESITQNLTLRDYIAIQIYCNNHGCTAKYAYTRADDLLKEKSISGGVLR